MKRKAKPVITKPPKYFNGPWVFPVPGNLEFFYSNVIKRQNMRVKASIEYEGKCLPYRHWMAEFREASASRSNTKVLRGLTFIFFWVW
jgi:hypothetical protein